MISERTVIDGRFELLEPLGSGGMGTVWRAYDLALHREVALKEVRPAEPDRESTPGVQRERVLREARALARIGHPNVVAIHHIVDSPTVAHPWIVMELVRGKTLAEHLDPGPSLDGGRMSPDRAAQIGRGILAALKAAHAVGILHRDIKPANVILRDDGSPVLTDFGIAAINDMDGLTSTGSVVGSLDYVAPERLGGQEGHPASDLWSLGLVLYVAVEGYHPMRRDTSVATLAAVLRGDVPPPRQAGALTAALQALLVPDPDQRPSADQLDWLLSQAITGSNPGFPAAHAATTFPGSQPVYQGAPSHPSMPQVQTPPAGYARPQYNSAPQQSLPYAPTMPATAPQAPMQHPPAPSGQRRWILVGAGVAAVLAVGVVAAVTLLPEDSDSQALPSQIPGTTDVRATIPIPIVPTTGGAARTTTSTSAKTDLLTPAGIRQAIESFEKATGGTVFTETVFYPEYANFGAPVKDRPTVYDEYSYRNGTTSRQGAGGQIADEPTITLNSINWDILPALLATAHEKLGLANPTSRYLIVNPAWTFNDDKPTLMVYLSDEYSGGGYIAANLDGSIVSVYAR
ncbi:protein kinase [Nocardia sp. NPDC057668]|uniref:serine/threonine-protein kinase n=1 Tax=Nocardia sp. NPDC057668 TaxID=3346202 RepID=UPI0036703F34